MSELAVGSIAGLASNGFVVDVASGSRITQPGMIVAVKDALKTDAEAFTSVAAGGNVAVTDLSITHEVLDPANKLIITAFFGVGAHDLGRGNVGLAVAEDGTLLAIGDAAGSRRQVSAGGQISASSGNATVTMPSITFVHTPGAGSKTFTARAINLSDATETLYINRSEGDADSEFRSRGVSSLVIQEVAV